MTEHQLKDRILKRLRAWDGYWIKYWGGPYAAAGVADIIGCLHGAFIAIELKTPEYAGNPKALVKPSQWNFLRQIVDHNGFAIVSNNEDHLFEELETIRRELLDESS